LVALSALLDKPGVERAHDRTRAAAPDGGDLPPRLRANLRGTVFAHLDCGDSWRERLGEIQVPTLVVRGEDDRFFPVGNGRAMAAEILSAIKCCGWLLTEGPGEGLGGGVGGVDAAA
jgi:pimeloyl-ACP methyl ester carboxylesterase